MELFIINLDYDSVQLSWQELQGAIQYELQYTQEFPNNDENWSTLTNSLKSTTVRKKNLESDKDYYFRIRPMLNIGWDMFGPPLKVHIPSHQIKMISPPIFKSNDSTSITIEWELIEGIIGYKLRYKSENDVNWNYIDTLLHSNSVCKKGLEKYHQYQFSILPITDIENEYIYSLSSSFYQISLLSNFLTRLFPLQLHQHPSSTSTSTSILKDTSTLLANKVIGVYFSAHWCGPCRQFTPMLSSLYQQSLASNKKFEIIFCSADHSEQEYLSYYSTMPWLAIDYNDEKREEFMGKFNVNGIPKLCILGPEGNMLSENAAGASLTLGNIDEWISEAGL